MPALQTLKVLPEVDERTRFGQVSVGYDKIQLIRHEVALLQTLASFACNCAVADLTTEKVQALVTELQQTQIGA